MVWGVIHLNKTTFQRWDCNFLKLWVGLIMKLPLYHRALWNRCKARKSSLTNNITIIKSYRYRENCNAVFFVVKEIILLCLKDFKRSIQNEMYRQSSIYRKETEPLYNYLMYSLVSPCNTELKWSSQKPVWDRSCLGKHYYSLVSPTTGTLYFQQVGKLNPSPSFFPVSIHYLQCIHCLLYQTQEIFITN